MRGKAYEIEDEVAQDGEVMGGVLGTSTHLIIAEDDIHAPMQAVFDAPVQPDSAVHALGVG